MAKKVLRTCFRLPGARAPHEVHSGISRFAKSVEPPIGFLIKQLLTLIGTMPRIPHKLPISDPSFPFCLPLAFWMSLFHTVSASRRPKRRFTINYEETSHIRSLQIVVESHEQPRCTFLCSLAYGFTIVVYWRTPWTRPPGLCCFASTKTLSPEGASSVASIPSFCEIGTCSQYHRTHPTWLLMSFCYPSGLSQRPLGGPCGSILSIRGVIPP